MDACLRSNRVPESGLQPRPSRLNHGQALVKICGGRRPSHRWRTQSAANPSLSKFPDNPRFTGKKRKKTGNPRLRVGYSHTLSIIYARIPYAMEQGILDNDQGMRTREQGMHLLVQGIAHWFGRRFKSGAGNHRELTLQDRPRFDRGLNMEPI